MIEPMIPLKVILFTFLSIPVLMSGQIEGVYCTSYGLGGAQCIKFTRNNKFEYKYYHCTGNDRGHGTYTLVDSTLTLHFKSSPPNDRSLFTMSKATTDSNLFALDFYIYDTKTKKPLPYVYLILKNSRDGNIISCLTNEDGKGIISTNISRDTFIVHSSMLGYSPISFYIIPSGHYTAKIYLAKYRFGHKFLTGDSLNFYIKDISKKSIKLDPVFDSKDQGYSTFTSDIHLFKSMK